MKVTKFMDAKHLPNRKPNWKKAFLYAKLMESGITFPPVNIFLDKNNNLTYNDGIHRVAAAKMTGIPLLIKITEK